MKVCFVEELVFEAGLTGRRSDGIEVAGLEVFVSGKEYHIPSDYVVDSETTTELINDLDTRFHSESGRNTFPTRNTFRTRTITM